MSPAMQDAIGRLQALPEDAQEEIALRLHDYLTRWEELRALIQEEIDSGADEPLEIEREHNLPDDDQRYHHSRHDLGARRLQRRRRGPS